MYIPLSMSWGEISAKLTQCGVQANNQCLKAPWFQGVVFHHVKVAQEATRSNLERPLESRSLTYEDNELLNWLQELQVVARILRLRIRSFWFWVCLPERPPLEWFERLISFWCLSNQSLWRLQETEKLCPLFVPPTPFVFVAFNALLPTIYSKQLGRINSIRSACMKSLTSLTAWYWY